MCSLRSTLGSFPKLHIEALQPPILDVDGEGWMLYNVEREFNRMLQNSDNIEDCRWEINKMNLNYKVTMVFLY